MKPILSKIRNRPLVAAFILTTVALLTTTAEVRPQGSGYSTTAINVTEFSYTPANVDVTYGAQTVTVTARVTDSERDVSYVYVTLKSPQGGYHGYDLSDRISGNGRDGVYRKAFTIHQYAHAGAWEVSDILVYDGTPSYYRWRRLYKADLVARGFPTQIQVINNNEAVPPEISDFNFTPTAVNTANGPRNITITLRAKDEASGVTGISVGFSNPEGCYIYDDDCARNNFYLSAADRISGDDKDGVYRVVGTVSLPLGIYGVTIRSSDAVQNQAFLHSGDIAAGGYPSHLRNFRITPFDFDPDGQSDISVWRPSNGTWFIRQNPGGFQAVTWGVETDKLTPADYDGDGRSDLAVFRPSTGQWFIFNSAGQSFQTFEWGVDGDIPVPADHDGDGRADLVLFRPTAGTWYTRFADSAFSAREFGQAGDQPAVGDFDGDGKSDFALYRPSNHKWYLQKTSLGFFVQTWGEAGDIPVPADYDGDGMTDVSVWRPSTGQWHLIQSTNGFGVRVWGETGDQPVPADYDGDGKADVAVFRPSSGTWYIVGSTAGFSQQSFGQTGDVPTQGAFIY